MQQQIQGELRIGGVILGSTGFEGFAVLRQHRRIDWEEDEEVVLLQRLHERPLGQLQRDGDGAAEALVHRACPLLDSIDPMRQAIKLWLLAIGGLQTDVVLRIGPIDADEGGELTVGKRLHDAPPTVSQ